MTVPFSLVENALMFALMFALMLPRCCLDGAWMLLSACMLLSASHPSRIHLHSSSKEGILGASVTVTQTWSKQVWNKLLAGRTAETQEVGAETQAPVEEEKVEVAPSPAKETGVKLFSVSPP